MKSNNSPHRTICIDFGTSHSKASICMDTAQAPKTSVQPLALGAISGAANAYLTPSASFIDDGRLYFGPLALSRAEKATRGKRDPALSFKMLFSEEGDPTEALYYKVRSSIDPTQTFCFRDILVLYLAYLEQLTRAAIAANAQLPSGLVTAERRYTIPVWRLHEKAAPLFEQLFVEARSLADRLGPLLQAPEGISIAHCRSELDRAATAAPTSTPWIGVFESHAALAAHWAYANLQSPVIGVIDMGAGTTDMAAFELAPNPDAFGLKEIRGARLCTSLAGDALDRIIINTLLEKLGKKTDLTAQSLLWRQTRLASRQLKVDLFAHGKTTISHPGRTLTLTLAEFERSSAFKEFKTVFGAACRRSLDPLLHRASLLSVNNVTILLAGGGAHFPFLPQAIMDAGNKLNAKIRVNVTSISPDASLAASWPYDLREAFPQIAVAMGGAFLNLAHRADGVSEVA